MSLPGIDFGLRLPNALNTFKTLLYTVRAETPMKRHQNAKKRHQNTLGAMKALQTRTQHQNALPCVAAPVRRAPGGCASSGRARRPSSPRAWRWRSQPRNRNTSEADGQRMGSSCGVVLTAFGDSSCKHRCSAQHYLSSLLQSDLKPIKLQYEIPSAPTLRLRTGLDGAVLNKINIYRTFSTQ